MSGESLKPAHIRVTRKHNCRCAESFPEFVLCQCISKMGVIDCDRAAIRIGTMIDFVTVCQRSGCRVGSSTTSAAAIAPAIRAVVIGHFAVGKSDVVEIGSIACCPAQVCLCFRARGGQIAVEENKAFVVFGHSGLQHISVAA